MCTCIYIQKVGTPKFNRLSHISSATWPYIGVHIISGETEISIHIMSVGYTIISAL